MKQEQLCIPAGVINGFCYPFARRCLDKLKEMEASGSLLLTDNPGETELGSVAEMFAKYLARQILQDDFVHCNDSDEVDGMMSVAEEFLDTFVVKEGA